MYAGCSQFPPNGLESDESPPNPSSITTQQPGDGAFPSPSRTSTCQPTINLIVPGRQNIQKTNSAGGNSNTQPTNNTGRPGIFNFLFRGRRSDSQNFISNEGSITVTAWHMINKQTNTKVRLKTLETLSNIARQRKLQVSTLEGIWTETCDMLNDPVCRLPFLNLIYSITVSQIKEIGLALRLTFFETIRRSIGLSDITVRWLAALTDNGKIVEPFEMSITELLAEWLEKTVLKDGENNMAIEAIKLCTNVIRHQSTFVDEDSLSRIIRCCCKRAVRGNSNDMGICLTLLEAVFEHCVVSSSELFILITTLSFIVCIDVEPDKTWKLFEFLLTSQHSYAVLALLQEIMTTFVSNASEDRREVAVHISAGTVYALAQALWGTKRIESLNCSPCVVLQAFEKALSTDLMVAHQVIHSIRRLVGEFDERTARTWEKSLPTRKTLHVFNWTSINNLLRSAVLLCGEDVEMAATIRCELHSVLSLIESLIERQEYTGSVEEFYSIVEECIVDRPDGSAINLLDYRIGQLTPEHSNWIEKVHRLLTKFLYEGVSLVRREKSVYIMHNFYKKYRILHEDEILRKIVLPICSSTILSEREISIQYYLICVLFDVAKIARINVDGINDLYLSILNVIGLIFSNGMHLGDNLEVAACLLGELLDERWAAMNLEMIEQIFNIVIHHLELHYIKNNVSNSGYEVRMRLFETLLLIQCHPINGQMARVLVLNPTQFKPIYNRRVIRAGIDTQGQFKWTSICEILILALKTETNWSTLERILEFLSGTIEHRFLIYTAGAEKVNNLVNAVLGVVGRVEERYPMLPKERLARYICPVLGKLINYTPNTSIEICKIIVQLVKSGCPQAIMACDSAIQVLPNKMAVLNRSLLENLVALKPAAQLAIPIIELLDDMVDVNEFHSFFQERHFRAVIHVLAPYSNARRYNAFIVSSVYQTAMRWFLCIPMSLRCQISAHTFGLFAKVNDMLPPLQKPPRASESPETNFEMPVDSGVKKTVSKESNHIADSDFHPTALIITPSKKKGNIKKPSEISKVLDQTSLENEINTAMALGEFFLQSLSDSPKTPDRNSSGDGRQPIYELPFDDPTPLFSTGNTTISLETDSIEDFKGVSELAQQILAQEYVKQSRPKESSSSSTNLAVEFLENLSYFIRFFRNKTFDTISTSSINNSCSLVESNEDLVEKCTENWVVDGTILTLRILVRPEPFSFHSHRFATISVDRLKEGLSTANRAALAIQTANRVKRATVVAAASKHRHSSEISKESDELLRRRHRSTKTSSSSSASPQVWTTREDGHLPEEASQVSGQATPSSDSDDVFSNQDCHKERSSEWIQLIIRHVFGKESYVLHSFSDIPLNIDSALGCPGNSDPTSLLLHLRGNHSAVHLMPRDNDLIARSLQFLDKMPTEEIHEVSVLYIRDSQHATMDDVLMTECGSDRFISFIRRLGRPCKWEENTADFCYEHVDLLQRIRFYVFTLTPCSNEAECQKKKKLIEETPICLVFNESGTPCKLGQLFRKKVVLEITPQDDTTVTINMHARKEIAWWIAMSRALLPDCKAQHVLQKMVVRTQRSWRCWSSMTSEESVDSLPYLSCAVERQRHIHKLRKRGIAEPF